MMFSTNRPSIFYTVKICIAFLWRNKKRRYSLCDLKKVKIALINS